MPPDDFRTLAADLFARHAYAVARRLWRSHDLLDEHLAEEAAAQAALAVAKNFSRFDPARGTLPNYLYGVARRILQKRLLKEARRREREKAEADVTKSQSAGKEPVDELADRELLGLTLDRLASTPEERLRLDLYLSGRRDHAAWVEVLGVDALPMTEQEAAVTRELARWRQKLHRYRASKNKEES